MVSLSRDIGQQMMEMMHVSKNANRRLSRVMYPNPILFLPQTFFTSTALVEAHEATDRNKHLQVLPIRRGFCVVFDPLSPSGGVGGRIGREIPRERIQAMSNGKIRVTEKRIRSFSMNIEIPH
jgi:hypothetical protein